MKRTEQKKNGFFAQAPKDGSVSQSTEAAIADLFYQYIPEQSCPAFAKVNLMNAIRACAAEDWTLSRIAIEALCSHQFLNYLSIQDKGARNTITNQLKSIELKPAKDYSVISIIKSFALAVDLKLIMKKPHTASGWTEEDTTRIGSELRKTLLDLLNTPTGMNKMVLNAYEKLQKQGAQCTVSLTPDKTEINLYELHLMNEMERAIQAEFN